MATRCSSEGGSVGGALHPRLGGVGVALRRRFSGERVARHVHILGRRIVTRWAGALTRAASAAPHTQTPNMEKNIRLGLQNYSKNPQSSFK